MSYTLGLVSRQTSIDKSLLWRSQFRLQAVPALPPKGGTTNPLLAGEWRNARHFFSRSSFISTRPEPALLVNSVGRSLPARRKQKRSLSPSRA
jgi:hypothetical protein